MRRGEGAEVFGQAVADVHHGADFGAAGEPRALGQTRVEREVMARGEAAAEDSGHMNRVADAGACAGNDPGAGCGPEESKTSREDAAGLGDVSADDGDAVAAGAGGEPAVKLLEPSEGGVRVQREREDGGRGTAAHSSEVAEIALEELCSDRPGRDRGIEVAAKDDGIDGDELRAARGGQNGTIVADPERSTGRRRPEPATDRRDQFCFAEGSDGVGGFFGEGMHGRKRRGGALRW